LLVFLVRIYDLRRQSVADQRKAPDLISMISHAEFYRLSTSSGVSPFLNLPPSPFHLPSWMSLTFLLLWTGFNDTFARDGDLINGVMDGGYCGQFGEHRSTDPCPPLWFLRLGGDGLIN
jgi:hypothetical protein